MNFSKSYKENSALHMKGNPLSAYIGSDIERDSLRSVQVETIIVPGSGSPMTYARHLYSGNNEDTAFIPENITISAAEQSGKLVDGTEF